MARTPYVSPSHGFWPVRWTGIKILRSLQTNGLDAVDITEEHIKTLPPTGTDPDTIDPVTGLSKDFMTAMDIIDSCDYEELRRFNAPLLANQTLSVGQQIEMYYNGGESEEHRRKREEEKMTERGTSLVEKLAGMMTFWRGMKWKKGGWGG